MIDWKTPADYGGFGGDDGTLATGMELTLRSAITPAALLASELSRERE